MRPMVSAGLLMYRFAAGDMEVLLGHPGGPYYEGKDEGYWSIPKGGVEAGENLFQTAIREFAEETGLIPRINQVTDLGTVTEKSGKRIVIWAFPGTCDTSLPINSNLFQLEWPPHSGILRLFPEFDKLAFYSLEKAQRKIERQQRPFLHRLGDCIGSRGFFGFPTKRGYPQYRNNRWLCSTPSSI